jgi:hypothetical protein
VREAEAARVAGAPAWHLARRPPGRRRSTRAADRPTQAPPGRSTGAAPARPAQARASGTAERPAQPALPTRARAEPPALRSWGCPRPALPPGRPSPDRRALPPADLPAPPRTERPWAAGREGTQARRRGRPNPRSGQPEPARPERPPPQPRPTREGPVDSTMARTARPAPSCPARAGSTKGPARVAPPNRALVRTARPTRRPEVRARAPALAVPRALPMRGPARQRVVTPAPASPRLEQRPARTEQPEQPAHPSSGKRTAPQAARRELHPRPATAKVARRRPATRARPTPTKREAGRPSSGPGGPAREAPTSRPRQRSGCLARPAGPEAPTSSCGGAGASSGRGLRRPALPARGR